MENSLRYGKNKQYALFIMGPQWDLYIMQPFEKPRDNMHGSGRRGGIQVHPHGLGGPGQAVLGCGRVSKAFWPSAASAPPRTRTEPASGNQRRSKQAEAHDTEPAGPHLIHARHDDSNDRYVPRMAHVTWTLLSNFFPP